MGSEAYAEESMGGVTRRTVLGASAAWPIMAPALAAATDRFRDQLQAFGEDLIRLSPEYALSAGAPAGFADRLLLRTLDDYSSAGEARLRAIVREKERALRGAHAPRPDEGAFALQVARAMAANASRSAGFSYGWLKPLMGMHLPYAVSHRSGPSASSADLMADLQPVSDLGDAEAYLEKLGAFGPAFAGAAEKLRADASIGCVVPAVLLEKAVAGMEAFTRTEPEGSPLVVEFVRKCERAGMPAAQVDRLRAVATARVGSIVYPAYAGLRSAALEQARAGKEAQASGRCRRGTPSMPPSPPLRATPRSLRPKSTPSACRKWPDCGANSTRGCGSSAPLPDRSATAWPLFVRGKGGHTREATLEGPSSCATWKMSSGGRRRCNPAFCTAVDPDSLP
jgi:hypothetical protein